MSEALYNVAIGNVRVETTIIVDDGNSANPQNSKATDLACAGAALATGSQHPDVFRSAFKAVGRGKATAALICYWLGASEEELTLYWESSYVPKRWCLMLIDEVDACIAESPIPVPSAVAIIFAAS